MSYKIRLKIDFEIGLKKLTTSATLKHLHSLRNGIFKVLIARATYSV